MDELPFAQRPDYNACAGTGRASLDGISAWHRWRLTHWGCKGEALFSQPAVVGTTSDSDPGLGLTTAASSHTAASAVYQFDTPGSPPIPFLAHAAEMFPAAEFILVYDEPGLGFAGRARFRDGQLIDDVPPAEDMWF
ncbi:DUF1281 family ferredoxin-like fold protein [Nocardia rhamnosiphila]